MSDADLTVQIVAEELARGEGQDPHQSVTPGGKAMWHLYRDRAEAAIASVQDGDARATEQRAEVERLTATLDKVRALVDPDGMPDLDPDDGWDLGYAYAMREVRAVLEES